MAARTMVSAVAFGIALLVPAAQAALTADARVSTYFITFDDLTFANANARYDVHVDMSGTDGDVLPGYNPSIKTGQQNFSWAPGTNDATGESFLDVSNVVAPGSSGSASADVALVGGASGAYDFGYDTLATGFASSWLLQGTDATGYTLAFSGGGGGLLDAGGLFTIVVFVQGDWRQHGTGPGELELIAYAPTFSANYLFDQHVPPDPNFGDWTIFSASGRSDGTTGFGPNLSFVLHGDLIRTAVPEPGTLLLLGIAVAGLATARRRTAAPPLAATSDRGTVDR